MGHEYGELVKSRGYEKLSFSWSSSKTNASAAVTSNPETFSLLLCVLHTLAVVVGHEYGELVKSRGYEKLSFSWSSSKTNASAAVLCRKYAYSNHVKTDLVLDTLSNLFEP